MMILERLCSTYVLGVVAGHGVWPQFYAYLVCKLESCFCFHRKKATRYSKRSQTYVEVHGQNGVEGLIPSCLGIQSAQNNGPYTAYTLYFGDWAIIVGTFGDPGGPSGNVFVVLLSVP